MTTIQLNNTQMSRPPHTLLQAIENGAARLAGLWNAAKNRRAVGRLLEWDDHMLRDIGLSHSDVHAALSTSLQDDPSTWLSTISHERRSALREQAMERRRRTGW
jgi:uncharacterized protein YjiS (DUF1127 family)